MPTEDEALRPSMPAEPDAQLRWLMARQLDASMALSTSVQQFTTEMQQFRHHLVGSPNLLERVSAGRTRYAIAALIAVVSLSSLVATATAFVWRDAWARYPEAHAAREHPP